MSIWSKIAEWYKEKNVLVHDDHPTMPSFSIEDHSSPFAKATRKLIKLITTHWIGIVTTIGVIATVIGTFRPQTPAPQAPPQNKPQTAASQPKTENIEKIIPKEIQKQSPPPKKISQPETQVKSEPKQQINAPNSAISINQSGGVTAHTINVGQQEWLVSPEQQAILVKSLNKTPVDPITVSFSYGNSEQRHFAESLIKALRSAGCEITVHAPETLMIPYGPGISVLIRADKPPYPKGSVALQKAFEDAKIDSLWYGAPNLAKDSGNIAIIIRSRP